MKQPWPAWKGKRCMWSVYDMLEQEAACEDRISFARAGESWVLVKTEKGHLGMAAVQEGRSGKRLDAERYLGMELNRACRLVRSWDFEEAALGLACINAVLNRAERFSHEENPDAFLRYRDRAEGRRVAVIGRFQYLETRLAPICQLHVLERRPGAGDYPDPACEYLLPEMDMVFITGCTVSNKTLPRLLELSRGAFTVVTGPSTPMTKKLFSFGADALCGYCATDFEESLAALEGRQGLFAGGRMVCLERNDT